MNTTTSRSKTFRRIGIALAIFVALGALAGKFFSRPAADSTASAAGASLAKKSTSAEVGGKSMLALSEHARAMASVETAPVERRKLSREVHAVGKVQYNESALSTITARLDGYIEKLFVD